MYDYLILGNGYCGSRLIKTAKNALVTSRAPKDSNIVYFDLNDAGSWKNLPKAKTIIWTFACKNQVNEIELFKYLREISQQIIIYSTSSVYNHEYNDQVITESSSLNFDNPRLIVEEKLRELGANIFTLCGIFGPNRDPKNWLLKGLIKSPQKTVNLIHVDDIIELTIELSQLALKSKRINLCSGRSDCWDDLAKHYGYEFPKLIPENKTLRKTIKSELLESLLKKNHSFLRATDFSSLS
jgi:nucleoside-diphosphate-sugar epimerase